MIKLPFSMPRWLAPLAAAHLLLACGGGGTDLALQREAAQGRPVVVADHGENPVWAWSRIASSTIVTLAALPRVTPEEQRPQWGVDHATVHLAIYDASAAIARTHTPFAITPTVPADGASMEAAIAAAAYGVLRALFPSRAVLYQPSYDATLSAIPDGDAKSRGLAVGAEVAAGIVALRANDGRAVALPPFVPGDRPGDYRGANPLVPWFRFIRPFTLKSPSQFRADAPPELAEGTYAADFNEAKDLGGAASVLRTSEQTESARFFAENVALFWPRNLRRFARSQPELAENARLMAMLWVTLADAAVACWDSKYHYLRWRPISAIRLADNDGNDGTAADATWSEAITPAPEHPEYPSAPGCVTSAVTETLAGFFGSRKLIFSLDSAVTGSMHHYDSVDAMEREAVMARIWSGHHFRTSLVHGTVIGKKTAHWVTKHYFGPIEEQAHVPHNPGP